MKSKPTLRAPASPPAPRPKPPRTSAFPALTPKLRFPNFRDGPGWETKTLGSLATISTEKVGENECVPMSITSGVGLMSQVEKFGRVIAGSSYKNYLLLKKNDFAYNKSATKQFPEGFLALYSGDALAAVPNSIFTSFRIDEDSLDPRFLNYQFLGNLHGRWLRKYIEVSARAHGSLSIDDDDLLALPVPLPGGKASLAEQQKIAECLSTLDETIGAENQKLDALKAHKKGLMQQLFPCPGETLPRLRFPEFRSAPKWEENPLSKFILSLDAGVSVNAGDRPAKKTEFGVLKTSAVTKGVFDPEENKVVLAAIEQSRLKETVCGGTIIICRKNTPALVGANAYVESSHSNLFLPDLLWVAKPRERASMRFLAFILGSSKGRAALSALASGSSVSMSNITKPDVLALSVMAPAPAEQHRIATCLSSLDELMAAQSDKLSALQSFKEGLMQQLFPSPTESKA